MGFVGGAIAYAAVGTAADVGIGTVAAAVVGGAVAGEMAKSATGSKGIMDLLTPKIPGIPTPAAAPAILAPTPLPSIDDAATKASQRQSDAIQLQRSGRASTILTNPADTLG